MTGLILQGLKSTLVIHETFMKQHSISVYEAMPRSKRKKLLLSSILSLDEKFLPGHYNRKNVH